MAGTSAMLAVLVAGCGTGGGAAGPGPGGEASVTGKVDGGGLEGGEIEVERRFLEHDPDLPAYGERIRLHVDARDPWTYAFVAAVLATSTLVAVWLPARRAARTDPAVVLRAN